MIDPDDYDRPFDVNQQDPAEWNREVAEANDDNGDAYHEEKNAMTTHELAKMLMAAPDVLLMIDDEDISAASLEECVDDEDKPFVILWTKD